MKDSKYGYAVEMYHLPADMGGGLMSVIPELPGCVGVGYSVAEALASVSNSAEKLHQQLGTVPVHLSSSVLRTLVYQAEQAGMSIDRFIGSLLSSYGDLEDQRLIALTE
ncbi:MAG: hypothetical protein ACM3O9_02950 [Methylocystaceae bacterium]